MDERMSKAEQRPSIQGFVPINRPMRDSHAAGLPISNKTSTPAPRPNKRKLKQANANLPSPPKTAKVVKKPRTAKQSSKKRAPKRQDETKTKIPTSAAPSSTGRPVLSELTRSKLNAFRHNDLLTPASDEEQDYDDLENLPPYVTPNIKDRAVADNSPSTATDSLLSSDLWKNQEPLPNYPWLYGRYPSESPGPSDAVSAGADENDRVGSQLLVEFLQTGIQTQLAGGDDEITVDDEELDKLFDAIIAEDVKAPSPSPYKDLNDQKNAARAVDGIDCPRPENTEEDEFPLDDEALESLYEATGGYDSSTKTGAGLAIQCVAEILPQDLTKDATIMPPKVVRRDSSPATMDVVHARTPEKQVALAQDLRSRFTRPSHPSPLQSPGPIPGLSPSKQILTCFRIGEAINATVKAQRQGHAIMLELYARVIQSIRAGPVQTFRIVDLWSSASNPGIVLVGRWIGWEGVELWEKDGRVFFEDYFRAADYDDQGREKSLARKCRIIGSLKRETTAGWAIDIKNLWEAGWDDIAFAKQVFVEQADAPV